MKTNVVLGVDVGGSHISAALVDLEKRAIIPASFTRRTLNARAGSGEILDLFCEVIADSFQKFNYPERKICMAMPGPFDYVNGRSLITEQEKFSSLYRVEIKSELAGRLAIAAHNIQFNNDAASFLLGEVFAGAAQNYNYVLGLTLGTGLGSAFYINGLSFDAALWSSGFLEGIAEDYLSTRWFVNRYHELTGGHIEGVKELSSLVGEKPTTDQIFKEFGSNLAKFIIPLAAQHQIQTVILGGNISLAFHLFSGELFSVLESKNTQVSVKISTLNEVATLIGAASCFKDPVKISTG